MLIVGDVGQMVCEILELKKVISLEYVFVEYLSRTEITGYGVINKIIY